MRDVRRSYLLALLAAAVVAGGVIWLRHNDAAVDHFTPALASAPPNPGDLLSDPQALSAFRAALQRAEAGRGQARVVVYGGSHTASDVYTGRLRELLQARFGDAGHGFVPLVPIIDRHWAWGLRIDEAEGWEVSQVGGKDRGIGRYGLAGAVFSTDEVGAFAAVESEPWSNSRDASRLTLLYDRKPGGGSLEVFVDARRVEVLDGEALVPEADSRTFRVNDGPHRLEVRALGDGPVAVFGAIFERDRPGVIVDNLGLVGAKARHLLLWEEALWREQFTERRPDLVVLAYGNNETLDTHLGIDDHARHFRAVLARVLGAAPRASCLIVGPTDRLQRDTTGALTPHPLVPEISEMQRELAREHGCAFFDTLAFQGGSGAALEWLEDGLLRDDFAHLTHEGYVRWGDALARALLRGL